MDLIRWSMNRPVSVTVGVLLVVLFGLIGLTAIPIQLTPTVDRPIVTVTTRWPGRSPEEIIDAITRKQEEQLKNVQNLKSMRSLSDEGQVSITLEFYVGSDIGRALREVSDALRQVPEYPEEVEEPTVIASEGAAENAIAWIIIDVNPAAKDEVGDYDITTLFSAMDKEVKPYLERIDGVAQVNIYGGRERQVSVEVDPVALAQRGLGFNQVIAALQSENRNVSAGSISEGKRDVRVRVVGKFESPREILETVIAYRDSKPVYVKDVATVTIDHEKVRGFVRSLGEPCLAMNVIRQSGSNVMTIMEDLRGRLSEVRTDILPKLHPVAGPHLRMRQVYDETEYIQSAIDLVLSNLRRGAVFAAIVLLLFLRNVRATGVIALAIPISVIGTFLVMLAAGRTLNVISLAGLAFSTGMVVDNAVVVLENIVRRRALGDAPLDAIYRGTREVWGAILASTLTTVCVFIPILTVREEVGQLFFDLSLALTVAVTLSLIVAIIVVPCACALLFGKIPAGAGRKGRVRTAWEDLFGLASVIARGAASLSRAVHWAITGWRAWTIRPALIIAFLIASFFGSRSLMPPLDYLPAGNRNLVFGGLLIPPGLSIQEQERIAESIEAKVEPYIRADIDRPETVASLPPITRFGPVPPFEPVPVENFFIGAFGGGMFVGGTSQDPQVVIPIGQLLTNSMISIPDSFGGARQSSIFGRGVGGGNTVDLEVSGPDVSRVIAAAGMMFGLAGAEFTFANAQPDPANFNLTQPEVRGRLNDTGREMGLRTSDVGVAVRGLFDGAFAGEYVFDGRTIDIVALPKGGRLEYKERLVDVPVATPAGRVVPMSTVVDLVESRAPQQIRRIEELPAVTIRVNPPGGMTIDEVMAKLREKVVAPAQAAGLIDATMRINMEGTAAKLDEVRTALFGGVHSGRQAGYQRALIGAGLVVVALGVAAGAWILARGAKARRPDFGPGALGVLLLAGCVGGLLAGIGLAPELLMARFVWALLVTYLLMCALFESFTAPLVIMFSVPFAVVGGFGALRIVHDWTVSNPTIAPQQLDVLTMIGFIILIGTVVNNAILLVEQSINFMNPTKLGEAFAGEKALPPARAIAESVRTRLRPVFMTTLTTIVGGLPLVISPGSGSEMYRGLGAVVCGGLFVSTVFTLVLVPLAFSMLVDMRAGLSAALSWRAGRSDESLAPVAGR